MQDHVRACVYKGDASVYLRAHGENQLAPVAIALPPYVKCVVEIPTTRGARFLYRVQEVMADAALSVLGGLAGLVRAAQFFVVRLALGSGAYLPLDGLFREGLRHAWDQAGGPDEAR